MLNRIACLCLLLCGGWAAVAHGDEQSRDEAWWTGPMLAPSAAALPQGHALIEPYLYDIVTTGALDRNGGHHDAGGESFGSLTYMLYGVTDRFTAGLIPRVGYARPRDGAASSAVGVGDLSLQAGYALTRYRDGSSVPGLALVIDQTLPTARYDRLRRASDGFGAGTNTTSAALYSQDYFWMPNGRILRARLDLTWQFAASTRVRDRSVYGTGPGFAGTAHDGASFSADLAGEYSLTRRWVLALDLLYQHSDSTRVVGMQTGTAGLAAVPVSADSGTSDLIGLAPAVEYNWSSRAGVLLGVRIVQWGRNISASVTPALAVNLVL